MLIKKIRLIDPSRDFDGVVDILIEDGKISQISREIKFEGESINGGGLICAPGFIDGHVHLREPGQTHKETIETGADAAAAGGFTRIIAMANTKPIIDTVEKFIEVQTKMNEQKIHVYSVAAITEEFKGNKLTDFRGLKEAGVVCLSDDGVPILNDEVMERACEEAVKYDLLLSLHEEDNRQVGVAGINEGDISQAMGIKGAPRKSEIDIIRRDLEIAKKTGARLNVQHISAKESVELIRQAKKNGVKVTTEATPHHFSLTDQAIIEFGTLAKVNPPIRKEADRLAIIEGLRDGTIDMIATDHAPHSMDEKANEFRNSPSGMIGLETALSLGLKYLVEPGYLSLAELIDKMSTSPAKIYGFDGGMVDVGSQADLVLFSTDEETTYHKFYSKSSNSPFKGQTLPGKIKYTLVNGEIVYQN